MMDALTEFLIARFDELEDAARWAPGPEWWEEEKPYVWGDESDPQLACSKGWVATIDREKSTAVQHMVLNSPAHMLRDVQARRATLARCQEEMLSGIPRLVHFAKQTLWEMAQRDADHKDFREAWRP